MTLEELDRWLDVYGRAWENKDVDGFVDCFTPDADYFWGPSWDAPLRGHDAIRARTEQAVSAQENVRFGHEVLAVTPDGAGSRGGGCPSTSRARGSTSRGSSSSRSTRRGAAPTFASGGTPARDRRSARLLRRRHLDGRRERALVADGVQSADRIAVLRPACDGCVRVVRHPDRCDRDALAVDAVGSDTDIVSARHQASFTRRGPLWALPVRPEGFDGATASSGVVTGAETGSLRLPPPSIATTEYE